MILKIGSTDDLPKAAAAVKKFQDASTRKIATENPLVQEF